MIPIVMPTDAQRVICDGFLITARAELGMHEAPGERDTPRVLEYLRTVSKPAWARLGLLHDATPWCSAFANWTVIKNALQGTGKANARSWLKWGEAIEEPIPGCLVVYSRPPTPWSGHVHFFDRFEGKETIRTVGGASMRVADHVVGVGGNQGNAVSLKAYPGSRVLGYRVPRHADIRPEMTS